MKKILFLSIAALYVTAAQAQLGDLTGKAKSVASVAGVDVTKLTNSIMSKLIPGLGLTNTQQPKVTDVVSAFLGEKSGILPLQSTNPTEYQKKQTGLFNTLKTKLGEILLKDQMNKFLGMKPATNTTSNPLSQLFY
jgi:hypothetical protein